MALFTATVTGNWNGAATWGHTGSPAVEGVDYPGNGDTFQVGAGITVTVGGLYPASGALGTGNPKDRQSRWSPELLPARLIRNYFLATPPWRCKLAPNWIWVKSGT